MGEFQKSLPTEWGWVDSGREVTDTTTGVVYRVDNQQIWVVLTSRDAGSIRFQPFDRIDQQRFQLQR